MKMHRAKLTALSLLLASTAGCARQAYDRVPADLIFTNAHVYTVETDQPWAEAIAIRGGKVIAIGSSADIEKLRGENSRTVNLDGRLLMPAFGDAHNHPVFGGTAYSRCPLYDGDTIEDYQRIIAKCVESSPGDGTIYGVGWEDSLFPPNGVPHKKWLDAVSTERALIFKSVGGHSYWTNSKALEKAGISKDTPDPVNGLINRDAKTGEPIGALQESARDLVENLIPAPSAADVQQAIIYAAKHFNSLGITSWHDAGIDLAEDGSSVTLDAYKAVKDRGALSTHVTLAFKWDNSRKLEQIPTLLTATNQAREWGFDASYVKFYLDGVIPQMTAAMIEPYEHSHERGPLQIEPDVLSAAVTQLDAQDIHAHVHAIGDRATRVALDAFAASRATNSRTNRPMISHMNVIDPADQRRFGELGVIAVFQPTWAANYPYMDLTKQVIGPVRSTYIYPTKSVKQNGALIAYGADWPVATANPILGLQTAVTRIDFKDMSGEPLLPDEVISLENAVRAHTINVAYANGLEDVTGSIKVGKSADLIVLDQNIFTLAPTEISKAKVVLTLFKGEPVFGGLDGF